MKDYRYYNGDVQLTQVTSFDRAAAAKLWPGQKFIRLDSFSIMVGRNDAGALVPAHRVVAYKKFGASKHKCDARCLNATGRVMNCECSCGGKNHGLGAIVELAGAA